ncbi:MAG: hypothetical protein EBT69_07525 [Verrucomicrobia bacterium]|nr:hypothetical protein [Verrucomicrobiota bacterium]
MIQRIRWGALLRGLLFHGRRSCLDDFIGGNLLCCKGHFCGSSLEKSHSPKTDQKKKMNREGKEKDDNNRSLKKRLPIHSLFPRGSG